VLKLRPAILRFERTDLAAGTGVIAFAIGCCALAMAVVVAVALTTAA
jgi:predicted RNA methylase